MWEVDIPWPIGWLKHRSVDEIDLGLHGNDASLESHIQQLADGFAAIFSVVQRALVDVHAHKLIGQRGVQVASELHGVGERLLAVVQGMLDAAAQRARGDPHGLFSQGTPNGIAAQGERKLRLLAPPLTKIERLDQAIIAIGELTFVDDESGIELACNDGGDDLVEGNSDGLHVGAEELQGKIGRGESSGDGDACLLDLVVRELARRYHHGAVPLAHRTAACHQGVGLLQVGIGVEADGGDIVKGVVDGALVQRLDVGERVRELEAGNTHLVSGEAIEHEGVVGVRAVGDLDFLDGCACCGCHGLAFLGRWFSVLGVTNQLEHAAVADRETCIFG